MLDAKRYPSDWKLRSRFIRDYRAKGKCEWCGAKNHQPHPVTGSKVVLTTAHVHDKRPMSARFLNLAALCQRCHLKHDRDQHRITRKEGRLMKAGKHVPQFEKYRFPDSQEVCIQGVYISFEDTGNGIWTYNIHDPESDLEELGFFAGFLDGRDAAYKDAVETIAEYHMASAEVRYIP